MEKSTARYILEKLNERLNIDYMELTTEDVIKIIIDAYNEDVTIV